jgi:hypothetical protein
MDPNKPVGKRVTELHRFPSPVLGLVQHPEHQLRDGVGSSLEIGDGNGLLIFIFELHRMSPKDFRTRRKPNRE